MGAGDRGITSVRVLGGVQALAADGSVIDLPSASQRRLLGILALHSPRRLRSEWLADLLEISPGALRTSVSRLRSAVGAEVLQTGSTGYSLVTEVDASQFCRAVADAAESDDRIQALGWALAIWTGPALEEFRGEEWADGDIARLTEVHAGTVDDYAQELISAHRSAEAVALLEGQIARHPFRDRSRGLLIRALASAGRQADALRAFQRYRSWLIDELGTEPSPEVVRIERRVATGWDGIESESEPDVQQPAEVVAVPLPSALAHAVRLVGRADELDVLASELALVAASGMRSVMLSGESGIGKTTLLAEFARSASSSGSATVVYGRCDETGVPLEPFRTVLGACVQHSPSDVLIEHVARCGGELQRICPLLATRVATAPAPTESDSATEQFLAFDAAADLLRRVAARRPLVLMLDDLQWAEPTALLMLRHISRSLADAALLLVLSRRDPGESVSDELRLAMADLERGETRGLPLDGFDNAELADLISEATPAASGPDRQRVAAALLDQTAGNPLYASQLIRHWVESGRIGREDGSVMTVAAPSAEDIPPTLRDVVWSRVHALGDDAADVLAAASVFGLQFDEDELVEMVDLPEPVVVDALDAATAAGLVLDARRVRRSMRFVHALVANALYSEIGPSRRARLHERAARALEKSAEEEVPPDVVMQLARHYALAGLPAEAQHWSTRAGDQALDHLAPSEASQHYRVALDMAVALARPDAERADLLVRLGDALHRSGDPHALETLEQGAELARRSEAHDALIRAAIAEDRGFMRLDSRAPAYLAIVEAALTVADPTDTPTYTRLLALLAQSLTFTPDATRRVALAHQALDLAERHRDPTLMAWIAPGVLCALWAPGSDELRSRIAAKAISAAEASGDPRLEFAAHLAAYNVAIESADHVAAARSLAKNRSTVRTLGEPRLRWIAGLCETFDATMAGRLEEAEAMATATLELGTQIGAPDAFTFFAGEFFVIGTFAGRHAELFSVVEQAVNGQPDFVPFKLAYGIICAAVGRDDVARAILRGGMAGGFAEIPVDNLWMTSVIGYAILAIELHDAEAAAGILPMIEPFATEVAFNGITSQGPVAAYVGKLASLLGHHDVAEDNLRAALETATAFGWQYHRATTLLALAQARHRRIGVLDTEGGAWLSEASDLCRAGGFRSWIPQIDALAEAHRSAARRR